MWDVEGVGSMVAWWHGHSWGLRKESDDVH